MSSSQLPFAAHLFQGNWFSRHEERLDLTSEEIELIVATLGPKPKKWDGRCTPNVDGMKQCLEVNPKVLERIGSRLLSLVVAYPGGGPAVQLLIDHGVRLNFDPTEYNVLHEAAHSGAADTVKVVFESGMHDATSISVEKPHTGWPSNLSLLYWAAWGGYPEFASVCLNHGAVVNLELKIVGNGERGTTVLQESVAPSHWTEDNPRTSGKRKTAQLFPRGWR